jgi:hypothetical protein
MPAPTHPGLAWYRPANVGSFVLLVVLTYSQLGRILYR